MNHICILEANHFPGLSFYSKKSNDDLIKDWTKKNKNILERLVDFYNPEVIVFGHTLEFIDEFDVFVKVFQRYISKDGLLIFGDRIIECSYIDSLSEEEVVFKESDLDTLKKKIDEKEKFNVGRNIKYLGKSGRIYIQANHPSKNYKKKLISIDCKCINKWITKENGVIKSSIL